MSAILNALKGAAIGVAESIPGVSGGTIAFITGIYERILNCIKAFTPALWGVFKQKGIKGVWEAIDGTFLFFLLGGMAAGLIGGVFGITYLLEHHPIPIWSFFFGLIIASSIFIARQIPRWRLPEIIGVVVGAVAAYIITILPMGSGTESLLFVFFSAILAISALMLPGISGSFVLLLLGMYDYIIPMVKTALTTFEGKAFLVLSVFAMGCLVGLLSFARVLSWLFKNFRNVTFATMTGFMLGSLNKIWPWRIATQFHVTKSGEKKVMYEENYMPFSYEEAAQQSAYLWLAILAMLVGIFLVFIIEKMGSKQPQEGEETGGLPKK